MAHFLTVNKKPHILPKSTSLISGLSKGGEPWWAQMWMVVDPNGHKGIQFKTSDVPLPVYPDQWFCLRTDIDNSPPSIFLDLSVAFDTMVCQILLQHPKIWLAQYIHFPVVLLFIFFYQREPRGLPWVMSIQKDRILTNFMLHSVS